MICEHCGYGDNEKDLWCYLFEKELENCCSEKTDCEMFR